MSKRHGLWSIIHTAKLLDKKSYREVIDKGLSYGFWFPNKKDIVLAVCDRYFKIYRIRTVGDWNKLLRRVSERVYTTYHRQADHLVIWTRKDSFPVIWHEPSKTVRLKRECHWRGESKKRLEAMSRPSYFVVRTNRAPDRKGPTVLYRHYDSQGGLLYVGISLSLFSRIASHKSTSTWFKDIHSIKIEHFENREQAAEAENTAIKSENPKYNRTYFSEKIKSEI